MPLAKWYPLKRAKKQRSASTQLTTPRNQATDSSALVLKMQALMPTGTKSGSLGADSVIAKAAITWMAVADGVQAELRLYDRLFLEAHPMRATKTSCNR
jgi:hypothetical protein